MSANLLNIDPSFAIPTVFVPGSLKMSPEDKKRVEKQIEAQRKEDHQKVKGFFINLEVPGGSETFCFRKYKGDPVYTMTMQDGVEYTVPRMVADHLNDNCFNMEHEHALDTRVSTPKLYDSNGLIISSGRFTGRKRHRFRFQITQWNVA